MQRVINSILDIINFAAALGMECASLSNKLGRRALSLLATGGMCASFVFGTICAAQFVKIGVTAAANAEIAFIFIYHVFCNGARPALRIGYAVEISHCIQASC
ncbi:hypothetical protein B2J93_9573 [Marssonina coronariae]|uniref:Uncharacterized protein n=1 Tax=Diplocarpon coronariae TaxID=2795749 RepID=A0A218YWF8_9HELO|nr:hypothetical protein B2J93_9573 [Marssonina coronariae]